MPFPFTIVPTTDDETFMLAALREAWQAYKKGEVPIGAVLVHDKKIIARGHNQMELLCDATAHAEMLCITAATTERENWRLTDTTLYTTIEPCTMCMGALLLSRIPTLVWGAPDIRHGANGSWIDVLATPHPTHTPTVKSGVLGEYSATIIKDFFKERRKR